MFESTKHFWSLTAKQHSPKRLKLNWRTAPLTRPPPPLSAAQCGGDLTGPGGVILSPNWPEWYGEGEDCSWRIHVGEDKRVLLDVQL